MIFFKLMDPTLKHHIINLEKCGPVSVFLQVKKDNKNHILHNPLGRCGEGQGWWSVPHRARCWVILYDLETVCQGYQHGRYQKKVEQSYD